MYDAFLATIHAAIEEFVCMKPPKGSYEEFPAFIRKVNDYRITLWSECNKPEVLEKYHQSTRKLRRLMLKFTRNKEQKMLRTKGSRDLFKHVARNVKTKSACIALLAESGEQIRNDGDKVEALAEHFQSVYTPQTEGPIERAELHRCCRAKLAYLNFFEDDVYKAARKCPMSYTITPDGIPPILLRGCSKSLSLPLAIIFNRSMITGNVPFQFKQSFITPIPKRPPAVAKNFRPISITSIVARTMERLVRRRLLQFLDEHNILPESRYGFRPKRSVRDALIGSIESWSKAIDANVPVDVIYFDLTAAFDKVQHSRLLHKLSSCGIDGYLLQWVRFFLTGRESKVRIGKTFSNAFEPSSSVPQGSVLGPLLFLVYVADVVDVLVLPCVLRCYADDVNIAAEIRSDSDREALQASVNNLVAWSDRNDLPLSGPKCNVLHLGPNNRKHGYTIGGKLIAEEVSVRDLGITITSDLRSKTHVSKMVSKANSKLFLFMRLIKSNDPVLLCRIFKVYVRPIVETCSSTFVVTTKKEVEQLESVQRRFTKAAFMRIFPGEDLPDYRERCRKMELETLEERRIRSDLILAKKILLGKCGTKSAFRLKPSRTRGGATKFDVPYSRTKMRESTFFVRVASTLSKLNADFVLNSTLGAFKDFVKDLDLTDVCDLVF
ncbi:RNA-directed DNA polymerase from mobile element jockey-like protein [Aphelenchoides avenae]|nr:RNA-directed DNA polymerase from mobile element jockey-like protein [Aphelenchus avenae]